MILRVEKANFNGSGVGSLDTYSIRITGTGVNLFSTTIKKNSSGGAESNFTKNIAELIKANYNFKSISVTRNSATLVQGTDYTLSGTTITINASKITGNIEITVTTEKENTGTEGGSGTTTPTMYTFTINPTPTNATVTLTATGYKQSGKSITVPANTKVTWKVSATGYTEQNGTHTVTKTESKSVALSETGGNTGGNIGGGSVEDETGITWYIDNAAQANKTFKYTSSFPGAGLKVNPERLTNKPINVIKFCPCGEGIFAFCKLTPGTQPAVSDVYTIDIPAADVAASGTDATPKTYLLDNTITLEDGQILMFSCNGNQKSIVKTSGFWVNAGGQPDYAVGVFNVSDYTIKDENWGLPFSIGYKS